MLSGKHLGKSFSSILISDPTYCQLAVASAEQEPSTETSMRRLAQYIAKVEAETFHQTPSQSSQTREDSSPSRAPHARTRRRTESPTGANSEESLHSEDCFRLIMSTSTR